MAVKEKKTVTNEYSKAVEEFKTEEVKKSKKKELVEKKKDKNKKDSKKKQDDSRNKKVGFFGAIKNWFNSVMKEISAVRWPTKKEMVKYSIATIIFIIAFSIFFLIIELVMSFLLDYFG